MAQSNVLVAVFIVTVAAVAAVVVQRDPFVRLIPADVLRGKKYQNFSYWLLKFSVLVFI